MKKTTVSAPANAGAEIRFFTGLLAVLLCLTLSACGESKPLPGEASPTPAPTESVESPAPPPTGEFQMTDFEIESGLEESYEYEYAEFSLGDGVYTTQGGREMPYKIRGVMAVPAGDGPFPLVLIAHGAHEEEDETRRFDTGFDYLAKGLAQSGYIAVSMDMLMPYIQRYGGNDDYIEKLLAIFEDHMQGLRSAHDGERLYPMDLTGKISFEEIALLGHSRSGAAVFQIAKDGLDRGLGVKAVLSLAPSADFWAEFPALPIAVLVPQYDGDVIQLDGAYIYDFLEPRIDGDHSVTILMGANHNFFNRNLPRDDSIARDMENSYTPLSREEQEDFLVSFAADFFSTSFGEADRFYHLAQPQPNKMYGRDINRQFRLSGPVNLIDAGTAAGFSSESAHIRHAVDSVIFREDELLVNTVTTSVLKTILDGTRDKEAETLEYVPLNRNLIGIEWNQKGALVSVTPLVSDFSGKTAMSIRMIPDSASELNVPGQALSFTVILRDTEGGVARVTTAANQNVLSPYPGELRETVLTENFSIKYWEPATPLGMLHIPLSYFEAVDIRVIQSMELLLDGSESGAILIASWQLQ